MCECVSECVCVLVCVCVSARVRVRVRVRESVCWKHRRTISADAVGEEAGLLAVGKIGGGRGGADLIFGDPVVAGNGGEHEEYRSHFEQLGNALAPQRHHRYQLVGHTEAH